MHRGAVREVELRRPQGPPQIPHAAAPGLQRSVPIRGGGEGDRTKHGDPQGEADPLRHLARKAQDHGLPGDPARHHPLRTLLQGLRRRARAPLLLHGQVGGEHAHRHGHRRRADPRCATAHRRPRPRAEGERLRGRHHRARAADDQRHRLQGELREPLRHRGQVLLWPPAREVHVEADAEAHARHTVGVRERRHPAAGPAAHPRPARQGRRPNPRALPQRPPVDPARHGAPRLVEHRPEEGRPRKGLLLHQRPRTRLRQARLAVPAQGPMAREAARSARMGGDQHHGQHRQRRRHPLSLPVVASRHARRVQRGRHPGPVHPRGPRERPGDRPARRWLRGRVVDTAVPRDHVRLHPCALSPWSSWSSSCSPCSTASSR